MNQARSSSGEAEVLVRHMSHTPGAPGPVRETDTDPVPSPHNSTWKVLDVQMCSPAGPVEQSREASPCSLALQSTQDAPVRAEEKLQGAPGPGVLGLTCESRTPSSPRGSGTTVLTEGTGP